MNPWLFYTDALRFPTYFTCLMIGFSLGTAVLRREALRQGTSVRQVMNLALLGVPMAMLGSRIFHILFVEPELYWAQPLTLLNLRHGGFVFYGGLFFGVLTVLGFARSTGKSPWMLGDLFAPAVAFGLAFGRLGCLGSGCCHGRPADWPLGLAVPWSVTYFRRGHLPDALLGVPVHPAPLYEAAASLLIFTLLSQLRSRQVQPGGPPSGAVVLTFIAAYGLARTLVELFRADAQRGLWLAGWLSTSQLIGLSSASVALILLAVRWRGARGA